jgi:hypothetical protein
MIREVKVILANVTRKHHLNDQRLITLICEAECMINSRPIAVQPDGTALTPSHLVTGRKVMSIPSLNHAELQLSSISATKEWNLRRRVIDSFWRTWLRSYLAKLRERFCSYKHYQKVRVGDLVLVVTGGVVGEPSTPYPRRGRSFDRPVNLLSNVLNMVMKVSLGELKTIA